MTSSLTDQLSMWTIWTHKLGDHYVRRSFNSDKNSRRSILNVMTSPLWHYWVT